MRLVAETTGAVIVLGVVDLVSNLVTFTSAVSEDKVKNQIGPVLSHKRSLIAEEQLLHGEIDRNFVDNLTPWLDPHALAVTAGGERVETKENKTRRKASSVPSSSSSSQPEASGASWNNEWFGGKSQEELNYKERIIKKFYDEKHMKQKQKQKQMRFVEIEEGDGDGKEEDQAQEPNLSDVYDYLKQKERDLK